MAAVKLAERVAELEKEVVTLASEIARLKEKVANGNEPAPELPWWERTWGMFANDPDYDAAMELGRKYRESLRPKPRKRASQKKAKKAVAKTR